VTEEIESRIERVLRAGPPLRLAVLFGSIAQDTARATSDVDIAILPTEIGLTLAEEGRLATELEHALRRSVDLVRIDHASGLLQWQIASTGKLLLSHPASEWTRFQARVASEHADIAPAMERYARLFLQRIARQHR
jgi:predicted nucleotidyltransferase